MRIEVIIEDTRDGTVALTVRSPVEAPKGAKTSHLFSLIEPVLVGHFKPVRTFYVATARPRKGRPV